MNVMTVYRTLKRLEDRGLLAASPVNRKEKMYKALSLNALVKKLESDERKIRKLQANLRKMTPFLRYLPTESEKISDEDPVELREGLDAFREEYLKLPDLCTSEFQCLGSMQNYWRIAGMSDEAPEEIGFRNKRFRSGIFSLTLNTPSPEAEVFAKRDSRELRRTRITAALPIKRDYMAFTDDRVCHFLCDPENPQVIIFRQPELLAMYRRQFRSIWDAGVVA